MSGRSRFNGESRGHDDGFAGSCKVYVGDLPHEATERDVERAFNDFGTLKSVWVARRPPGFAFVEFNSDRDAARAIREVDGTMICGGRVKVALSNGKVRPKPWLRGGAGGGDRFERRGPPRDRGFGGRGGFGSRGEDRNRGRDRDRDRGRDRDDDRGRDRDDDSDGERDHAPRRDACNYCGKSDHASWECRNTLRNRKSRSRSPNNDRERRRRKEDSRSPSAEKSRSRSRSRSADSKDKAPARSTNGKTEQYSASKTKHNRSDDEQDSAPAARKRNDSAQSDGKAADSFDEDTQ